jgi:pimeloyl-[acyl-carrier protein] methyl ester esterase
MHYVFLHGWCFDRRVWQTPIDALQGQAASGGQAITCHRLDLPGYGLRLTATAPDTIVALADDLDQQLAALPLGDAPFVLVGWSLGALAALAWTAQAQSALRQRLQRLVLVSGTASFISRPQWPHGLPAEQLAGFQQQLAADAAALPARFALLANQGDSAGRSLSRQLRDCVLPPDSPQATLTLAAGLACLAEADLVSLLPQVAVPTLLLHGELDPLMPLAAAQALAAALPQAELQVFPGRAHAPFLAEPETFARQLLSVLPPPPATAA